MTTVAAVLADLSARASSDKAAGWDPQGLQIGDPTAEVTRVAVCHEVTQAVADRAIESATGLLIAYHPLLFEPSTRWIAGADAAGRAYRLARAGVGVAVIHTAWDAARGGTADALAEALGLSATRGFGALDAAPMVKLVTFVPPDAAERVSRALFEAGAGRIGNYGGCSFRTDGIGTFEPGPGAKPVAGVAGSNNEEPELRLEIPVSKALEDRAVAALLSSHPYEEPAFDLYDVRSNLGVIGRVGTLEPSTSLAEFAFRAGEVLGSLPRCSGDRARGVDRVAVLPGSGGSFVRAAADSGAAVYVTGDLSHHDTRAALDFGMSTIDPGHAATERPGVLRLLSVVRTLVPEVLDLTDDPTPWKDH
jgi:dinuclear metal center YbgI/SA1388 family protein